MIEGKKVLAVIPARGGSKGIARKNIINLGGKPLIAWTIEEALKSAYLDRLVLSSDDQETIELARQWGCEAPFVRPAELAQDSTPGIAPVLHALEMLPGYEYVVLLQPTSPFRQARDIDGCIELCMTPDSAKAAPACVSVTEPNKSPYWMYTLNDQGQMQSIVAQTDTLARRQDLPKAYALNGAVYVANSTWLSEKQTFLTDQTLGYVMPPERSLDIDTKLDLKLAEFYLSRVLGSEAKNSE